MGVAKASDLNAQVQPYYDKNVMLAAVPNLVHAMWGLPAQLIKNAGMMTARFITVDSLPTATTPLTEGVNPVGGTLSTGTIDVTPAEYGDYVSISNFALDTVADPVLNATVQAQGDQAGRTLDEVCRDVLNSGTSVLYAGNVASRDLVTTEVVVGDLDRLIMQLATGLARPVTSFVPSDGSTAVTPVAACYPCIMHPHLLPSIRTAASTNWQPVREYAQLGPTFPGEVGCYQNLRFIESTNSKIWTGTGAAGDATWRRTTGNKDVYSILAIGANAYGQVTLGGETIRVIVKSPENIGGALSRFGTSGWVAVVTYKLLNDDYIARLEVAAKL